MLPKTEAELAQFVADATGPLSITGGGTRPIGATATGAALSTAALSGITLYEPGALTLVAQAGTLVAEIEAALDTENQRLAFEPMDHRALLGTRGTPTIGGVVAGNVSGPRRVAVGACRDHLLGVRYIDGMGQAIKNGGRVMKNVTGYDIVKVMAGSWGTLGVMSEVSLKVLPQVETSATLTCDTLDTKGAVTALSAALGTPFEVTGAAYTTSGRTHIRIEGFEASVAYRVEKLQAALASFGAFEPDAGADWAAIRDVADLAGGADDIWRLSVKPSDAPDIIARAEANQHMIDWGGGLFWLACDAGTDLRARLGDIHGHATLIRASAQTRGTLPTFHPESAAVAALTAGLRQKFDPRGIFNPGLMG